MSKKDFKFCIIPILISTILVTILSNFEFVTYDKYFLFPITALLITYIYIVYRGNYAINKRGYIYAIPIFIIILGTFFFKTNISNMIINIIMIPILISILFLKLTNPNYDISGNFLKWLFGLFPYKLFSNLKLIKENRSVSSGDGKKIKNIIIGILISIPFAAVILILLTSADMYFNEFIIKIIDSVSKLFDINYILNNILVFILCFITMFSVFYNIIANKNKTIAIKDKKTIEGSIVNTVLIIINFIFVLFIISEISKLAGNFLKLPSMYTYAEYAREGFFQLLLVTVINFSIIFYLLYRTDAINTDKKIKCFVLMLITFTILLIFNSYYRMFLYMYEYGFTVLRTQVILFLFMELIVAILLIKRIISNLKFKDAYILYWIFVSTYVVNILICNINVMDVINKMIGYE